jgi:transposase
MASDVTSEGAGVAVCIIGGVTSGRIHLACLNACRNNEKLFQQAREFTSLTSPRRAPITASLKLLKTWV